MKYFLTKRQLRLYVFFLTVVSALGSSISANAVCQAIFRVNTTADTYDGVCNTAHCSLRDAIAEANACVGPNEVKLGWGTYNIERLEANPNVDNTDNTRGDFDITDDITISGNPLLATAINASFRDRIFEIWKGTVKIQNIQLVNGRQQNTSRPGSAIHIRKGATAMLTNLGLYDNGSLTIPGSLDSAIAVSGILRVEGGYFQNNNCFSDMSGRNRGGAVVVMAGGDAGLRHIYATQHHNGVIASSGTLSIADSDFVDNAPDTISPPAVVGAAVVTVSRGSAGIYNSRFINNRSNFIGGAIAFAADNATIPTYLTVSRSTFRGNSTSAAAGSGNTFSSGGAIGIYGSNSFANVYDSVFIGNHAIGDGAGGGAIDEFGNLQIYRSVFEGNIADYGGGAIMASRNTLIHESSFTQNIALFGGAFYGNANASVFNSTFDGNVAVPYFSPDGFQYLTGAAMYISGPTTKIKNVTMTNNYDPTNPAPSTRSALGVGLAGNIEISYTAINNDNGDPACGVQAGFTSYGYNVIGDNSCPFAQASSLPIGLGPLTPFDYKGASGATRTTLHRIPELSSALRNAGESFVNATDDPSQPGCTRTDARGASRPISGVCDIGAIEATQ